MHNSNALYLGVVSWSVYQHVCMGGVVGTDEVEKTSSIQQVSKPSFVTIQISIFVLDRGAQAKHSRVDSKRI